MYFALKLYHSLPKDPVLLIYTLKEKERERESPASTGHLSLSSDS